MQKKNKSFIYSYLFQEYSCVLPTVIFTVEDCWVGMLWREVYTKAKTVQIVQMVCVFMCRCTLPLSLNKASFSQTKIIHTMGREWRKLG